MFFSPGFCGGLFVICDCFTHCRLLCGMSASHKAKKRIKLMTCLRVFSSNIGMFALLNEVVELDDEAETALVILDSDEEAKPSKTRLEMGSDLRRVFVCWFGLVWSGLVWCGSVRFGSVPFHSIPFRPSVGCLVCLFVKKEGVWIQWIVGGFFFPSPQPQELTTSKLAASKPKSACPNLVALNRFLQLLLSHMHHWI